MSKIRKRLGTAWAALLGRPIISGVSVSHGEITLHRADLYMSGASVIESCRVNVPGPVIVRVDRTSQFTGNEGDAVVGVRQVS